MTNDILDPSALMAAMPLLLPSEDKTLNSPQDGIAALLHTALVALSFRLTGMGESSTPLISESNSVLPTGWNKHGPAYYSLIYKHDQSSLDFLIKLCKLGTSTVINAIALQSEKPVSFDISTDAFTSASFYPKTIDTTTKQPLVHGFISSNRISDLISQFKLKIIAKLIPGLQKDGYTESAEPNASSSSRPHEPATGLPHPRLEPPPSPPRRDFYRQPIIPRNPYEIGRRDLDPFPVNPFAPPSLFPPDAGDGMFVGPTHPMFNTRRGLTPGRGPWGGDGYLPPLGAPPGARFDPIAPEPGPLGIGGRRLSYRHGGPDNDEFMPPGMGDSFM